MLLALTNATRIQSIHLICLNNVYKFKSEFVFKIDELVKQSRPGDTEPVISCKAYSPERRLCIYIVLKEYLIRTKKMRDSSISRLLLRYVKLHKNVTKDTISRWIKVILNRSGINTKIFGSHSVRSASTSKTKSNAVPIDEILKKAGWSNFKTFAKFYDKKIAKDDFAERGTEAVIIVSLIITCLFWLVYDIHFTEFGAVMTTVLPVLFKYCYKYCYSDSRKL
jgi:hypothetical protein